METLDWNITELADHCHVSRPMLSEMLAMKTIATTDVWDPVAESLGMPLHVFDLLARNCLDAELSP